MIFRAAPRLFIITGLFASLFVGLGIAIAVKTGDWTLLDVVVGATAICFLLIRVLRLEIRSDEIFYRNLSGNRTIAFTDIVRAYFDVIRADVAPQGVARFWLQLRDGKRIKINLRTFPIRASALLFYVLEGHKIPIEVPGLWAAQRMASQIHEEQMRLEL